MAAANFRNAIGVDQLENLQKIFVNDLNEKEFVEKFKQVLGGNVDEEVLIQLFLKIDASSDGRVDWEEFTNYMFLGNADQVGDEGGTAGQNISQRFTASDGIEWNERLWHRGGITRMLHCGPLRQDRLLTAGKDGTVRIWDGQTMEADGFLLRDQGWITDMCLMQTAPAIGGRPAAAAADDDTVGPSSPTHGGGDGGDGGGGSPKAAMRMHHGASHKLVIATANRRVQVHDANNGSLRPVPPQSNGVFLL